MNLLTPKQVAQLLGVKVGTLANMRVKGTGPVYLRLAGRSIKYKESDLEEYIESCRRQSTMVKMRDLS